MDLDELLAHRPSNQSHRMKPGIGQILHSLGLDVTYDRAAGDFVYYLDECGREVEVLDLVAGYGTLLLGHNHPTLVAEATRFLASGRPNHVQGSRRRLAEQLAEQLMRRSGRDDCAVFANSGTEAVEAAVKHAMLETGGTNFLALEGAFHGKTLGALQLTANPSLRHAYCVRGLSVVRVPLNDIDQLEKAFEQSKDLAGFIFEPILGEGGVRPLTPVFAQRMVELCRARNVPSIADECQSGTGRTGAFLASSRLGIRPDYVILSKTLGGGLAKISTLLIDRRRYRPSFDLLHTSTFADDDFSCAVASKTIDLIDDRLLQACREKGHWLLERLDQLRQTFPSVIAEVRGAGLMIGIELRDLSQSTSFLLRQLSAQKLLGMVVAGHLLKPHRIRIAPTLSDPLTLRIQPSALISEQNLERFIAALTKTCERLAGDDVIHLTMHLPDGHDDKVRVNGSTLAPLRNASPVFWRPPSNAEIRLTNGRRRSPSFAWLFHLIDAQDVTYLEPALTDSAMADRDALLNRLAPLCQPIVMPRVEIQSALGNCIGLWPILLPVTSSWLKQQIDTRRLSDLKRLLGQSVRVAESLGVDLVSLGQFTSIVSGNGRKLLGRRFGLTTGNSYTTALIVEAVRQAQVERGISSETSTLAVVGAAGNIGRACAEILAPDYSQVILVGRDRVETRQRLRVLARQIRGANSSCDLASVRAADVVVCVTNCVEPVLGPEHFRPGAIVCDASIPSTVRPQTQHERPDVKLFRGGVVRLPNRERLNIPGLPLPPGHAFGCLAEGAILCLEGIHDASYTGRLCPQKIARITQLAARHGFGSSTIGTIGASQAFDLMEEEPLVRR